MGSANIAMLGISARDGKIADDVRLSEHPRLRDVRELVEQQMAS